MYANQRLASDGLSYSIGKRFAIDSQRVSGRNGAFPRQTDQQGIRSMQFFFEQPGSGVGRFRLQRIGTHQFGEILRLVRRGRAQRAHFIKVNLDTTPGALPRRFRTCQAGANDLNRWRGHDAWVNKEAVTIIILTHISGAATCAQLPMVQRLAKGTEIYKITRSSPTRLVTRSRSRYSSKGMAYLRVMPVNSLNSAMPILGDFDL